MGTGIKGFKSQKILKQKLKGYTEDQSIDYERYATIQELTGDKHGLDVVIHGAFNVNLAPLTVGVGSNIRVLKITAHGASKGDQIRFIVSGIEASVLSVPDVDTIILGSELSFDPTGLTVDIIRHVTPSYNADGSLNVVTTPGPIQFNKDGVTTTVNYDTVTPSSSEALPVNIVTVNGQSISTTVDLSGAQINVQLSDTGTSPDSVRIGNGTNRLDINANKEALVHDADALAKLTNIDANTDQLESKLDTIISNTDQVETKLDTISTQQTDGTQKTKITDGAGVVNTKQIGTAVSGTDVGLITQALIHGLSTAGGGTYVDVKVAPSGALQVGGAVDVTSLPSIPAGSNAIGSVSVSNFPATQPVSGSVSVSNFPATQPVSGSVTVNTISGFATETTLSTLSGNITTSALAAVQYTVSTLAKMINTVSVMVGWDGAAHRELSVDSNGKLNVNAAVTQGYVSGTLKSAQITVGTSQVRATTDGLAPSANRNKLMIKPSGVNTDSVFLIASGGSTATGMEIIGPDRLEFAFDPTDYYLISNSAGQVVEIVEVE